MKKKKNTKHPLNFSRIFLGLVIVILVLLPGEITAKSQNIHFFSVFSTYHNDLNYIANRFSLVIWHKHPDVVARLPLLHEKNPQIKALMYRELFCILRKETPLAESVGHYDWIMAHHPEWFQKDTKGRLVEVPDYPGRFMMDVGNPLWQDFWVKQTLQDVKEGRWDGVFIDDVLTNVKMHQLPPLQNYPHDENLQAAIYSFLKKVYPTFHAEGILVIANVSNSYDYPGLFQTWLQVTDGMLEEHCSGSSWMWGPHVAESQLESMQMARQMDKWYLCLTYGNWNDTKLMDLSLATYLMGSGSKVSWAYRPDHEFIERFPIDPDWMDIIGKPLEESQRQGVIWQRQFEGGSIYINPTEAPQKISYRGKQYPIKPLSFIKFLNPPERSEK